MRRLRSILWLVAGLLLAAARPQLGAATVTGAVTNNFGIAQTNLPITFTPWPAQMPRALGGGGVMPGTGGRILTDAEGRFSVTLLPGLYSAQIGALATRAWLLEVPTNGGTFDWTSLATTNSGLAWPTNGYPFLLSALGDVDLGPLANNHGLVYDAFSGVWTNKAGAGGGVTAHNELTGLEADDHPQYQLRSQMGATGAVLRAEWREDDATSSNALRGFSLAIGLDGTNHTAAEIGTLSNWVNDVVTDLTGGGITQGDLDNAVNTLSNVLRTDYLLRSGTVGTNATNFTLFAVATLGTNSTNFALSIGQSSTNFTVTTATQLTNLVNSATNNLVTWATATFQPKSANLDEWSANGTNRLGLYLTITAAAASYQPLDPDLNEWASRSTNTLGIYALKTYVDTHDANTTNHANAQATAAMQSATNRADAQIAAHTNLNHLRITNNIASQVQLISAASNGTNYLLNAAIRSQHIDVTGNVRIVGLVGGLAGYELPFSICLSNGTGSAYTLELTNIFKPLRGHTNTIPANGVTWLGGVVRGDRVSYGAVPEQ